MAQTPDLAATALQHDWGELSEIGVAVRRSLDDALADLVRAAVEDPTASYAASCTQIDRAFEDPMAPYQHLAWAMDQAEALQRALKDGLRQGRNLSDENGNRLRGASPGRPSRSG